MKNARVALLMGLFVLSAILPADAREAAAYSNPGRYSKAVSAFEARDKENPPPVGAIVCIGSSSMRGWKTIHEDLGPLTLVHRGFGGSNMNDVLHFADRLVIAYRPRAVLLYEGDNDVAAGIPPIQIRATYDAFVTRVRNALPDVRFYVLSVKPSVSRWKLWPQMQATNRLLSDACEAGPQMTFIDVGAGMLTNTGEPDADIFLDDMLHMNAEGYAIWTRIARPVLLKAEGQYEH